MPVSQSALAAMVAELGPDAVLSAELDLKLYEYDGGADKGLPDAVVFPRNTEQVVALVNIARQHGMPLIGRGAGTGLSGGAIPRSGGLLISFARMKEILSVDLANGIAVVQPGVVNLDITRAVEADGFFFAPDPSSQRACTVGGNVAENAGGPHTLAYGVTTNHVTGLEAVLVDGNVLTTGTLSRGEPSYDLTGLLTGSEGTLALLTKVAVRLMRAPEAIKTMLAIYGQTRAAGNTVGALTARGIVPTALEMLDGPMLRTVEAATHAGYPVDAAAVLLIEVEGLAEEVEELSAEIETICRECGALSFKIAQTDAERALLWKGRKNAFGAIGRVSPFYYVQDGVVPRTKIAQTLEEIDRIGNKYGLVVSNIFHAGDGNLHPILPFDPRKPEEFERVRRAGDEILAYCVSVGGAITGEHGVGMEKTELMPQQFSDDTLTCIARLKAMFDPECRLNPGKILPTGKGCMEIRQRPGTDF